jgi:hypothetical protein
LWYDIKYKGIAKIEKLVGEYNIWELEKSPYGKFKIKVYINASGSYSGYTNLQVMDESRDYYCAVGHGKTEEDALSNTISEFLKMVSRKDTWTESDFKCSDSFDF